LGTKSSEEGMRDREVKWRAEQVSVDVDICLLTNVCPYVPTHFLSKPFSNEYITPILSVPVHSDGKSVTAGWCSATELSLLALYKATPLRWEQELFTVPSTWPYKDILT
jgi:hypothetical protein